MNSIVRYPIIKNNPLQAWNSADELIIEEVKKHEFENKRVLVINDNFGAISCTLKATDITTYVDSYISYKSILHNSNSQINPIYDLSELSGKYDFVLIQIPKNMSFFEDILCHLTRVIHEHTIVICTSMIKHLSKSSFELLEKYIGEVTTSLAKKKARLLFSSVKNKNVQSPFPKKIKLDGFNIDFLNHSNIFSREKLDIGTRYFLEHIPKGEFKNILDLGCANGCVGIKAKLQNPSANIIFCDESSMAIKSANENYSNYFNDKASFFWTNCFEEGEKESVDLVLCNPPFHQVHTIGDFIAIQMFKDSKSVLNSGGKIIVIGNSHLAYQVKLKKIFGNSKIIASNKKFMIIEAFKV